MPLDQSQRASEPTPQGSLGDLRGAAIEKFDSDAEKANKENAGRELSMIEALKESEAFKWFEAEFIEKLYRASFDALRAEATTDNDAAWRRINARYVALRGVKAGMIEREIVHRRKINPKDPTIEVLRQTLAAL